MGGVAVSKQGRRGNALIVAALSLSVAAVIISVAQYALSTSTLRQTNAAQQGTFLATQAALSALNEATSWLTAQTSRPAACTATGCATVYTSSALTGGAGAQNMNWWVTGTNSRVYSGAIPNVASQPRYVIEQLKCDAVNGNFTYKITALGTGASADSTVFLSRTINTRLEAASAPVTFNNDLFNEVNYSGKSLSRTLHINTTGMIQLMNVVTDMRHGVSDGCPYNYVITFSRNGGASTQYQGSNSNLANYLGDICYNFPPYSGGVAIAPGYPVSKGDTLVVTLNMSSYPNEFNTHTLDGTANELALFLSGMTTPSFCP